MPKKPHSPIYATGVAVDPATLGLDATYQITLSVSRDDYEEMSADELKKLNDTLARVTVQVEASGKPTTAKKSAAGGSKRAPKKPAAAE